MNGEIFRRLVDAAEAQGVGFPNSRSPRWLKTSGEDDREFMAKADVLQTVTLSRHRKALIASHEGTRTLVFVGFDPVDQPPEGLSLVPASSGIFAVAATALGMETIASGDDIRDKLEFDFYDADDKDEEGHPRYTGHEIGDILPLFPRLDAYSITEGHIYTGNIHRCVGLYLCYGGIQLPLTTSQNLTNKMALVFEAGGEHIPYNNILQGILSFTWSAFYLDIYRCVERLFLIPRVKKLAGDLKSGASLLDYCRFLETHLSWRPKEEEALRMLLGQCENDRLENILAAFKAPIPQIENADQKGKATEKAAAAVYKLRNDIVHFRPANEVVNLAPEQWNEIIEALVVAMQDLYEIYHTDLEGPAAGAAA